LTCTLTRLQKLSSKGAKCCSRGNVVSGSNTDDMDDKDDMDDGDDMDDRDEAGDFRLISLEGEVDAGCVVCGLDIFSGEDGV